MKKIILILSTVSVLLNACSKSDTASPIDQPKILAKKIIQTQPSMTGPGLETTTYDYQYIGNKIFKITKTSSTGSIDTSTFTYTGDLITKVQNSTTTTEFNYDANNRLIAKVSSNNSNANYVYNSDGTVTERGIIKIIFTASGDIASTIETHPNDPAVYTHYFTYDNFNAPFKNIIGNSVFISYIYNPQKYSFIHNCTNQGTYTYNSEGYPLTSDGGGGYTVQYFY